MSPIRRLPIKGLIVISETPNVTTDITHAIGALRFEPSLGHGPECHTRAGNRTAGAYCIFQAPRLMELAKRSGFVGIRVERKRPSAVFMRYESPVGIEAEKASSSCACCSRPSLLEPPESHRTLENGAYGRPVHAGNREAPSFGPSAHEHGRASRISSALMSSGASVLLTTQCIREGITNDLPQVGSGRDDEYVRHFLSLGSLAPPPGHRSDLLDFVLISRLSVLPREMLSWGPNYFRESKVTRNDSFCSFLNRVAQFCSDVVRSDSD